jgi:hypothetical protein
MLNRVEEINTLNPDIEWRYCSTDRNPADIQSSSFTTLTGEMISDKRGYSGLDGVKQTQQLSHVI